MSSKPNRLLSLDAFRGITIAGMILVNSQGGPEIYYHLRHASWNEWTLADMIFPFFLFIIGVVIPFSINNRLSKSESRKELYCHVIRRTLIIFSLGLFINAFPYFSLSSIRILGVLQRIALCYFFVFLIVMNTGIRGQSIIAVGLLIFYWLIMELIPVPGYGAGVLELKGNLAQYIDNLLMHGHMNEPFFDSEGLLSTLPAISTTLFGVCSGHILFSSRPPGKKVALLWITGGTGLIAGIILDNWFPINKYIWTSSYAVFTAGAASIFFSACYWLIEVKDLRRWSIPFVIYGTNAITVYVLSSLVDKFMRFYTLILPDGSRTELKVVIFTKLFASWASPVNASLLYALAYMFIWMAVMAMLYRRKIFIKI